MKPLRPCPICGRKPHVYSTAGEHHGIECWAEAGKSWHVVRAGSDESYEAARKEWNGLNFVGRQENGQPYGGRAGIRKRLEED